MGNLVIKPFDRKRKATQAFDEIDVTADLETKF